MDGVFLLVNRGNRLSAMLGLQMDEGVPYRFSNDYSYVEIPVGEAFSTSSEEIVTKAAANQKLRIRPACKLNVRGQYRVLVKVNPVLAPFANYQGIQLIDPNTGEQPVIHASFHKSFDFADLEWCVRLYILA